jgi:hypothetical protein
MLGPHYENGETWRSLHVVFPADIPTHSREQTFYFNEQRLLQRIDYTAVSMASHHCFDHLTFDGLVFPTLRQHLPEHAVCPSDILVQSVDNIDPVLSQVDGIQALVLAQVKPRDLASPAVQNQSDGKRYWKVSKGRACRHSSDTPRRIGGRSCASSACWPGDRAEFERFEPKGKRGSS